MLYMQILEEEAMSIDQDQFDLLEEKDVFDSYYECITACFGVAGEDVECVTECVELHLNLDQD